MKAFTLTFVNDLHQVKLGIVLKECVDREHNRVAGLPVSTGGNSIITFNDPHLRAGDTVHSIDFDLKWSRVLKKTEYEDMAFIYIPFSPYIDYRAPVIQRAKMSNCFYGGRYHERHANGRSEYTDAVLLLGASECLYLECYSELEKIKSKYSISFDGVELQVGQVMSVKLRPLVEQITEQPPVVSNRAFGTTLGDLLKKKI